MRWLRKGPRIVEVNAAASSQAERWRLVEKLFYEAVELRPESRAELLERACGSDPELRKEVESLLEYSEKREGLLEKGFENVAREFISDTRREALAPGARLDHYEIASILGAGGMGEVYLAEDLRLRRKVAVKVLTPELTHDYARLRRFEHEARTVSALNHPNIITIYEVGQAEGLHFIATEFIDGVTVKQKLASGRLDFNTTLEISIQVAGALVAAHASGVIHRDIKPENLMVRNDGVVKVLDFGIAKLAEHGTEPEARVAAPLTSSTQPGTVIGTPRHMSPEQARGVPVDTRSDIFSFGTVMYEMVAGRPCFEAETQSDIIAEILKGNPPPLLDFAPDVPPKFERIIGKMLRKDREARYQSAKELLIDFQELKRDLEFEAQLGIVSELSNTTAGSRRAELQPLARQASIAAAAQNQEAARKKRNTVAILILVMIAAAALAYYGLRRKPVSGAPPIPRSLAVLPFRNLKQDEGNNYLGFSLADAIITKLGYIGALTVRPSSDIEKYRNQAIDPKTAARELQADTLLTGSFVREGEELRINTQLVDTKADRIFWEDTINVKYDKLPAVQDRVAQAVVHGLELNLSPQESARLHPDRPVNALAYEYYLRGVDLYALSDYPVAIKMLEKSAEIDPNYAPVWAHLGRAYTTSGSLEFGGLEEYAKAQAAYEKALVLNPALIEPRVYMANLLTDTGRVEQAVPLLREALKSSPNNAEAHWELGYAYRFGGMLKESIAECERARKLDPGVKINSSALNSYLYVNEYSKFLESLPASNAPYILFYRGFGEYYRNNLEQATTDFDRAFQLAPSLLQAEVGKALADGIRRQNVAGLKLLRTTENGIEKSGVSDAEGLYKVAQAYAVLGDISSALRMLRRTIDGGFFCYPYFAVDPLLRKLHGHAEFDGLLREARERHEHFKARFFENT